MSRTYKDRPYLVRSQDPKELRYARHNHYRFGRTMTRYRYVYDEYGNMVMHTVKEVQYDYETDLYYECEVDVPLTEAYVVASVAEHCTLNETVKDRTGAAWSYPCGWWLLRTKTNRPLKSSRRRWHGSRRNSENKALVRVRKVVNSQADYDDYDEVALNRHTRVHEGRWN